MHRPRTGPRRLPAVLPADAVVTPIASLRPFDKGVTVRFTVLAETEPPRAARDGNWVFSFRVADASASIIANMWNAIGAAVAPGDVILMSAAFVPMHRGHMRLACRVGSTLRVGRLCQQVCTAVDMSADAYAPREPGSSDLVRVAYIPPHSA